MQTNKTKEKKSKKLSRLRRDNFSSWSIYEELLGQYNSFSPAQSDCDDQVFMDDPLVRGERQ